MADNVRSADGAEQVASFCVRRHVPHEGLYDLVLRSALLGGEGEGVVSTFRAAAISFDHAVAIAERWLGSMTWSR